MQVPSPEHQEVINDFRTHLRKNNYEFKEHNQGFHFRVVKQGVTLNVYPTSGKILTNDNKRRLKGPIKEFFS